MTMGTEHQVAVKAAVGPHSRDDRKSKMLGSCPAIAA